MLTSPVSNSIIKCKHILSNSPVDNDKKQKEKFGVGNSPL